MEAEQPEMSLVLQSQDEGKRPIIEIAFPNGMWWSLPQEASQLLYDKYIANESDIGYTWDWGDSRPGSWRPEGEETSVNRYLLDFARIGQTRIGNNRKRSFRIAGVKGEQVEARWTGQIPE